MGPVSHCRGRSSPGSTLRETGAGRGTRPRGSGVAGRPSGWGSSGAAVRVESPFRSRGRAPRSLCLSGRQVGWHDHGAWGGQTGPRWSAPQCPHPLPGENTLASRVLGDGAPPPGVNPEAGKPEGTACSVLAAKRHLGFPEGPRGPCWTGRDCAHPLPTALPLPKQLEGCTLAVRAGGLAARSPEEETLP